MALKEQREEELLVITKYCRKCGKKLTLKKKWNKVEYDEMNGDELHFSYLTCPDIENKAKMFDENNMPITHSQTYKIKRVKK